MKSYANFIDGDFWVWYIEDICICLAYSGHNPNPFCITPSYTFWAPWIGRFTRSSTVYNTEYRKCVSNTSAFQFDVDLNGESGQENNVEVDHKLSLDDLVEMMEFTDVRTLHMYSFCKDRFSPITLLVTVIPKAYYLFFYFIGEDITESLQLIFSKKRFSNEQSGMYHFPASKAWNSTGLQKNLRENLGSVMLVRAIL